MDDDEHKKALYYASCAAGLETVVLTEVEKLQRVTVQLNLSSSFGGLVFSTESSPEAVFQLRSVDNLYAFLGHFKDLPVAKDKAIPFLKDLPAKLNWDPAMQLFWKCQAVQNRDIDARLTFRVTSDRKCLKMKKHPFSSVDAAAALGNGIQSLHGWPADMRGYKAEVFAWIRDTELVTMVGLVYCKNAAQPALESEKPPRPSRADSQLYSRRIYRKALVRTSLKPSVAYALLQQGHIRPGDIVLDPMCGCGTILLEASDYFGGQVACFGGDHSSKAVSAAEVNIKASENSKHWDMLQWNATFMPMRDGCVDWVISDMPFGVGCGSTHARDWLCSRFIIEVARVLTPGSGIAILMSQGKAMKKEMESTPYLKLLQQHVVDMEGILVEIYVAQRNLEPVQVKMVQRHVWKQSTKRQRT